MGNSVTEPMMPYYFRTVNQILARGENSPKWINEAQELKAELHKVRSEITEKCASPVVTICLHRLKCDRCWRRWELLELRDSLAAAILGFQKLNKGVDFNG